MKQKHFDVRKEMLARPNEWVGSYQDLSSTWFKVGFDYFEMVAVETTLSNKNTVANYYEDEVILVAGNWIDKCIPIEDVPKEEI